MKFAMIASIGIAALASAAFAQPAAQDLGTLTAPGTSVFTVAPSNGISWFKFVVPEVSSCQATYLDIYGDGTFVGGDTEMGLYDGAGKRVANDDDDGPGTYSALTFGTPTPARNYSGAAGGTDARPGDGRDGFLAAGTYYLALSEFDATFNDNNWEVFPGSATISGTPTNLHFVFNTGTTPPTPAGTFWESLCVGDPAGRVPASAEHVDGSGAVLQINGFLRPSNDIDMYRLCVTNAAQFSADTSQVVQWDTALFLFDQNGRGVAQNDNFGDGLSSHIDSSAISALGEGVYYLAIVESGRQPVDASGQQLWSTSPGAPDGPGAANPVADWTGDIFSDAGGYAITLTGVSFCGATPTCGSADFNCDGDTGTDADIESFFACLAGSCPGGTCSSNADFNGDGDTGTDADIEAFFRVLAGGTC